MIFSREQVDAALDRAAIPAARLRSVKHLRVGWSVYWWDWILRMLSVPVMFVALVVPIGLLLVLIHRFIPTLDFNRLARPAAVLICLLLTLPADDWAKSVHTWSTGTWRTFNRSESRLCSRS